MSTDFLYNSKRRVLYRSFDILINFFIPTFLYRLYYTDFFIAVIVEYIVFFSVFRNETVKLSASLETKSSHPLAASIVNHYSGCITDKIGEFGVDVGLPEVTGFKNHEGMGLSGSAEGHVICVGNLDLMETFNIEVVDEIHQMVNEWSLKGCTVIFAGIDNKVWSFRILLHRKLCL